MWHSWIDEGQSNLYLFFDQVEEQINQERILVEETEVEERFRQKEIIKRFTYLGEPAETFTTAGIFRAGQDTPQTAPLVVEHAPGIHKIWQWDNKDSGAIDLLFVRALTPPSSQNTTIRFEVTIEGSSTAFASTGDVGFARCKEMDGRLQWLDQFNFGLEPV